MCKKVIVFDLDDTLYKEIDFLKSGYRKVAELVEKRFDIDAKIVYDQLLEWYQHGENAFANLNEQFGISNPIAEYLNIYRYHHPSLTLSQDVKDVLAELKATDCELGIITDGRAITQRQKIDALGLKEWIPMDNVLINEDIKFFKPNHWSYDRVMLLFYERYSNTDLVFFYVGDNTEKDFLAPNQLGWKTVCLLDNGENVHKQSFNLPKGFLPQYSIDDIGDLIRFI